MSVFSSGPSSDACCLRVAVRSMKFWRRMCAEANLECDEQELVTRTNPSVVLIMRTLSATIVGTTLDGGTDTMRMTSSRVYRSSVRLFDVLVTTCSMTVLLSEGI